MKKTLIITFILAILIVGSLFSVTYAACTSNENRVWGERYSFPGDGDDCYAVTESLGCTVGSNGYLNFLSVSVHPHYLLYGNIVSGKLEYIETDNAFWTDEVESTCPSNTGVYAISSHTIYCYECNVYVLHGATKQARY